MIGLFSLAVITNGALLSWRSQELTRLQTESQLIETTLGTIKYASFGEGPAVLVLHGTIGGYDQAQTTKSLGKSHLIEIDPDEQKRSLYPEACRVTI